MISILIDLLIFLLIMGCIWWIVSIAPLPTIVKQIVSVILVVICVIFLIYNVLLPLAGHAHHSIGWQ